VVKLIHPITLEAAIDVASNLRPEDRREVEEGHGVDSYTAIISKAQEGSCVYFNMPNGKTAGMAGVEEDGLIWMLTTKVIYDYPITFARESKRYVEHNSTKTLWNIADKRNTVHLKLLKFLGFTFDEEIKHGPNNLIFIKFYK
tara:strand:+ start:2048 stop:2476 length:429 start_codon:yes stop_codon:yes gene_type:complete